MQPDLPAHPYKVSRLGTHQKSVYLPYLKYPVRILGWGPAKITEVFHAFPQCHHRNSRIVARIGLRILPATSFENQHSPIILKFQSIRKDKVELQLHFHTVHLFVCPVITRLNIAPACRQFQAAHRRHTSGDTVNERLHAVVLGHRDNSRRWQRYLGGGGARD